MEWESGDPVVLRAALSAANPEFTPDRIDAAVEALRRQHEDPEEHDRSLIAERLTWTPDERLRALQGWLDFVDQTRAANQR
jgi:hypothetical protein